MCYERDRDDSLAGRGSEDAGDGGVRGTHAGACEYDRAGAAKLLLAGGTLKPLRAEAAVAIGVYLERYEELLRAARALSEARERGNTVDFWRSIATIETLAREGEDERDPRVTA
jgi:hypothetical protein